MAAGVSDRWKVTCECDMSYVIHHMWHVICKIRFFFTKRASKVTNSANKMSKKYPKVQKVEKRRKRRGDFIVLVLLCAHVERVGVSHMQDLWNTNLENTGKKSCFLGQNFAWNVCDYFVFLGHFVKILMKNKWNVKFGVWCVMWQSNFHWIGPVGQFSL